MKHGNICGIMIETSAKNEWRKYCIMNYVHIRMYRICKGGSYRINYIFIQLFILISSSVQVWGDGWQVWQMFDAGSEVQVWLV